MVSTPKIFTDNSPMPPGTSMIGRNPISRNSLCIFTEVLGVKNRTATYQVGAAKPKRKLIRAGSMLWLSIPKRRVHM